MYRTVRRLLEIVMGCRSSEKSGDGLKEECALHFLASFCLKDAVASLCAKITPQVLLLSAGVVAGKPFLPTTWLVVTGHDSLCVVTGIDVLRPTTLSAKDLRRTMETNFLGSSFTDIRRNRQTPNDVCNHLASLGRQIRKKPSWRICHLILTVALHHDIPSIPYQGAWFAQQLLPQMLKQRSAVVFISSMMGDVESKSRPKLSWNWSAEPVEGDTYLERLGGYIS